MSHNKTSTSGPLRPKPALAASSWSNSIPMFPPQRPFALHVPTRARSSLSGRFTLPEPPTPPPSLPRAAPPPEELPRPPSSVVAVPHVLLPPPRHLTRDVVTLALSWLTFQDVTRMSRISRLWHSASMSEALWAIYAEKFRVAKAGSESHRHAFIRHIRTVRGTLDAELEGLERQYKNQSVRLRQSYFREEEIEIARDNVQRDVAPNLQQTVAHLEERCGQLEGHVRGIEAVQHSLQYARRDQDDLIRGICQTLEQAEERMTLNAQQQTRSDFVRGFERRVARAILYDATFLGPILQRGVVTLYDVERTMATISSLHEGEVQRKRWLGFQRVLPLNDDYWDLRAGLLGEAPMPRLTLKGGPPPVQNSRSHSSLRGSRPGMMQTLGFGESPRIDVILRLMWDMSQMTHQDLAVYVTR